MAAALVMLYPRRLSAAALLRPLSPFAVDPDTRLPATIIDGRDDERRLPGDGSRLAQRLTRIGADIAHHVLPTGHAITEDDIGLAREWLTPLL